MRYTYVYRCPKCKMVHKLKIKQTPRCMCGEWTLYAETIDELEHEAKLNAYWKQFK